MVRTSTADRGWTVGVAVVVWCVTGLFARDLVVDWRRAAQRAAWPSVQAAVVSTECVVDRVGPKYQKRVELTYAHQVQGAHYVSKGRVPGCHQDWQATGTQVPYGSKVRAFYDPAAPEVSTLEPKEWVRVSAVVFVLSLFASIFFARLAWLAR